MSGALICPVACGTMAPTRNGSLNWLRMFSEFGLKFPVTWPAKEALVMPMRRGSSIDSVLVMPFRGFIQWAGFTSVSYLANLTEDTGDGGWRVAAFTANFGNRRRSG
jgi:hypothetical protein